MIIHVDMDAFYASVEERENPELRGRPLVVAGDANARGVVSAANYEAREFGIHSAMPTAHARRLCRDLLELPVRMPLYVTVSAQIRSIFARYTPMVEPLSLDEAFLDTRGSEKLHGSPESIAREIKSAIRKELSLVASVGVAPNKFLAKLASDHDKPDGFTVIERKDVRAFLDPMPVERLWGVGSATHARLRGLDLVTVGDLRAQGAERLGRLLGRHGLHLYQLSCGEDAREVVPEREARSISHETTFAADISKQTVLESVLMELTESVCARCRAQALRGRTVTLKMRTADFRTTTSSRSLPRATDSTAKTWSVVQDLFEKRFNPCTSFRLVGVGLSNFDRDAGAQLDLFDDSVDRRDAAIDILADRIRSRFGRTAIRRGKGVRRAP
ncbi:MAG: DNA polymerase IV [Proteobacteria bacterium]|nr:MAG: DNA polymerase IV [Pseudomonadota bacterium]